MFSLMYLLVFSFISVSFADILFLDLNNNPQEIEVARKSAEKRGEKLIVYPSIDEELGAQMKELEKQINAMIQEYSQNGRQMTEEQSQEFNRMVGELGRIKSQTKFDLNGLKAFLKNHPEKVKTVVVSGHDGNNQFGGSFGDLRASDMCAVKEELSEVKSLFLAGCYTAKPGTLENSYKACLPKLDVVAGYDHQAPLGNAKNGHKYLKTFLDNEKMVREAKTEEDLRKMAKKVITHPYGAICTPGFHTTPDRTLKLSELKKHCEDIAAQLKPLLPRYNCYNEAQDAGCENPPENTGQGSELRQIYNIVQDAKVCFETEYTNGIVPYVDAEQLIKLIFARNVQKNFSEVHKDDLRKMAEFAKELGFPRAEELKDLSKKSRKEVRELLKDLQRFTSANISSPKTPEDYQKFESFRHLEKMSSFVIQNVADLSTCVPFPSWVEASAHDRSKCDDPELFRKDFKETIKANANLNYRSDELRKQASDAEKPETHPFSSQEWMRAQENQIKISIAQQKLSVDQSNFQLQDTQNKIMALEEKLNERGLSQADRAQFESELDYYKSTLQNVSKNVEEAKQRQKNLEILLDEKDKDKIQDSLDKINKEEIEWAKTASKELEERLRATRNVGHSNRAQNDYNRKKRQKESLDAMVAYGEARLELSKKVLRYQELLEDPRTRRSPERARLRREIMEVELPRVIQTLELEIATSRDRSKKKKLIEQKTYYENLKKAMGL